MRKDYTSIDVRLPDTFSDRFVKDLKAAIDPAEGSFKYRYLCEQMFTKYTDPTTTAGSERKRLAVEKWLNTELNNAKTNARLWVSHETWNSQSWVTIDKLESRVRRIVRLVLGELRYPDVLTTAGHTNGASTRVKRSEVAAIRKLVGNAHCTSEAVKHWLARASNTQLSAQPIEIQEYSALFTVPKNSDIDRVACKEPEINMLLQRSVGNHIRRCLHRKCGINLNDQTVNQELARSAAKHGVLATIDLSSASDSISRQLVFNLLPWDWFSLLDDLRAKTVLLPDGTFHNTEMFSSMGNGFTFELESLLFYAITRATCELSNIPVRGSGRLSVYGDDIIAPSNVVPRLIRVFSFFGFTINEKKTFWTGLFRESCGKHYHGVFDVSPFFVRRAVSTLPDLINILNQVCSWACRTTGFIEDPEILLFHQYYSTYVPSKLWGGHDPNDNSSLVTGHSPRFSLTAISRPVHFDDAPALVHWYLSRENNNNPVVVDPKKQVAWKMRRASKAWRATLLPWMLNPM